MKRIRRVLGNRNKRPTPEINIKELVKKKRRSKRQRWDAILSRLPINRPLVGAEIGVLNGNTAFRILRARPLLVHYMIDPWTVPKKDSSYFNSDENAIKSSMAHEAAYNKTLKRVEFAGGRAIIMRMFSHEAAQKIKDGSLDFVFVDGDHTYLGVSKDLKLWINKLKKGGWIGGHDYDHPKLPGVKKAVDEFFEGYTEQIELDDNRTWFVRF